MNLDKKNVVVIGGGAAGMMAAITAARQGACVTLLERNAKVGRKLYITGKGRCNVTNHCSAREVMDATPRNGKFLHSALERMSPTQVEEVFEALGVELEEDLAALLRRFRDCATREPRLITRYQENDGSITESSGSLLEL